MLRGCNYRCKNGYKIRKKLKKLQEFALRTLAKED